MLRALGRLRIMNASAVGAGVVSENITARQAASRVIQLLFIFFWFVLDLECFLFGNGFRNSGSEWYCFVIMYVSENGFALFWFNQT